MQTSSYLLACASSSVRGRVGPDRARVRHRRSEHEPVEVVRHVVVMRDRRRVALLRVAPAVQPRFFGRRRERLQLLDADDAQRLEHLRRADPHSFQPIFEREHAEHVALDVELAGDVRAAEAELVGRGDEPAQRAGRPHHDRGAARRSGPARLPSYARISTGRSSPRKPAKNSATATSRSVPRRPGSKPRPLD